MSSNRTLKLIGVLLLLLILVGLGVFAYIWTSGGSGEASQEVVAPTLVVDAENVNNGVTFDIVAEKSTASFEIYEELGGVPTDVVGTTQEVAGQIFVNFENPAASEIGTIRINMRTLATNNEFRNRTLRSQILQSTRAEYEFSDFVPTDISGLPESVTFGEPFTFTINGNLTVVGVEKPVTFTVTATAASETELIGTATAEVRYADWGIIIPSVPQVANVSDTLTLKLEFVAVAAPAGA